MKHLTALLKKLRLRQMLTVFLAGLLLMVNTACASADNTQGANPNNPAVQAGGANNPYKGGGDKYTDSKMSKSGLDQASLDINSQLIATAVNTEKKLYPGAETPEGRAFKEAELPIKTAKDFEQPEPGGLIQREQNVGERIQDRLETVGKAFQDATSFVKDKADEAGARPETQTNPAVGK